MDSRSEVTRNGPHQADATGSPPAGARTDDIDSDPPGAGEQRTGQQRFGGVRFAERVLVKRTVRDEGLRRSRPRRRCRSDWFRSIALDQTRFERQITKTCSRSMSPGLRVCSPTVRAGVASAFPQSR